MPLCALCVIEALREGWTLSKGAFSATDLAGPVPVQGRQSRVKFAVQSRIRARLSD